MTRGRARSKKGSKKKYQIEMTSFSVLLWGFCLFFLLGWIFFLGILVGRGFLSGTVPGLSELKDQINKLQEIITSNRTPVPRPGKTEESDPKLAFYERLSNKKDTAKTGGAPGRPTSNVTYHRSDVGCGFTTAIERRMFCYHIAHLSGK